jgi:beta-glucosidase
VNDVFCDAHRKAVDAIKGVWSDIDVGLTLAMQDLQPVDGGEERAARIYRNLEDVYLEAATGDDFIGVQTYTRERVGPEGTLGPEEGVRRTIMGYEFWPEALEACIRRAWSMTDRTPIIVTENGIAAEDDARRVAYVTGALQGVQRCIDDGLDVRGYFYWTALDNFEWLFGYRPTFGLVGVDRQTFERTPKPSASWLGSVARANALVV